MSDKEMKIDIKVRMRPLFYIKCIIFNVLHSKKYGEKLVKDINENSNKYVSAKINGKEIKF